MLGALPSVAHIFPSASFPFPSLLSSLNISSLEFCNYCSLFLERFLIECRKRNNDSRFTGWDLPLCKNLMHILSPLHPALFEM